MKGQLLNHRYRILEIIAQEEFSSSFLAIDTHLPSKRRCKIKKLQAILGNSQIKSVKQRFEREARIIESLGIESEQIPQLYAYFAEGGDFYLVQEWIEGITLKQKQEQVERVSELEVRTILLGLLPLLDYVHSRHIVHRDIKPENIILRQKDDLPVLIDFGAVKEVIASANHQQHTQYSTAVGTPEYMPAEQAIGRPLYSSDLYSLGLTAIFLLTGKSPSTFKYDSLKEKLLWHDEAPYLESNLASVIDRAIRPYPGDRFASAQEMLLALQSPVICLNPVALSISTMGAELNLDKSPATTANNHNQVENNEPELSVISPEPKQLNRQRPNIFLKALMAGVGIGVLMFGIWQKLFSPTPPMESVEESSYFKQPQLFESQTVAQKSRLYVNNLPIFPPGVDQTEILQALGEPTKRSKGYWPNSRAWLYANIVPDKMDLGYLLDSNTKKLRQTEISFAASVEREIIAKILASLLLDNQDNTVDLALKKVYLYQSDRQEFTVGNLEGIIQRQAKNRIYTAVWDADFH